MLEVRLPMAVAERDPERHLKEAFVLFPYMVCINFARAPDAVEWCRSEFPREDGKVGGHASIRFEDGYQVVRVEDDEPWFIVRMRRDTGFFMFKSVSNATLFKLRFADAFALQ